MRMIREAAAALVLSSVSVLAIAEEQPKRPTIREKPVVNLHKPPQEANPKTRYARTADQTILGDEQKQHVLQAIGHLESARFSDEARKLREVLSRFELAELERQKERKAAELQELEARIQELLSHSMADRVVTIRLCMIEISHDWLAAMLADLQPGYRLPPIEKAPRRNVPAMVTNDGEAVERLVGVLSQQGVINVLSRPVIKTLSGKAAQVVIGGQVPQVIPAAGKEPSINFDWFGQLITAIPTILDEKSIRLNLSTEQREQDSGPEFSKETSITTTFELKQGQTVLLLRPNAKRDQYVLTVVKPEVDSSAGGTPIVAKPRAESPYTAVPLSPPKLEPVPEPIPETAELPPPATVVR